MPPVTEGGLAIDQTVAKNEGGGGGGWGGGGGGGYKVKTIDSIDLHSDREFISIHLSFVIETKINVNASTMGYPALTRQSHLHQHTKVYFSHDVHLI